MQRYILYHPKQGTGILTGYKVRINNDSVVYKMQNGKKYELKITEFGKYTFWAKTEAKDSVVIDVKKGEEYFIRCGRNMGVLLLRPDLHLIENHIGIKEYQEMEE